MPLLVGELCVGVGGYTTFPMDKIVFLKKPFMVDEATVLLSSSILMFLEVCNGYYKFLYKNQIGYINHKYYFFQKRSA